MLFEKGNFGYLQYSKLDLESLDKNEREIETKK